MARKAKSEGLSTREKIGLALQGIGATMQDASAQFRGEKNPNKLADFGANVNDALDRLSEDAEEAAELASENAQFDDITGGKGSDGILNPDIQTDANKLADRIRGDDKIGNKLEAFTNGLKTINLMNKASEASKPQNPLDGAVQWKSKKAKSALFSGYIREVAGDTKEALSDKRSKMSGFEKVKANLNPFDEESKLTRTMSDIERPDKLAIMKNRHGDNLGGFLLGKLGKTKDEFQDWAIEKDEELFKVAFPLYGRLDK